MAIIKCTDRKTFKAVKFDGENVDELKKFCGLNLKVIKIKGLNAKVELKTTMGSYEEKDLYIYVKVDKGDWIVKSEKGARSNFKKFTSQDFKNKFKILWF